MNLCHSRLLVRTVAVVLLASAPPTFAAVIDGVLIDDFIVPQTVEVTTTATAIGFNATSASGITAIGGERELYVRKTAGGNGERVRSRVNPEGLDLLRMTSTTPTAWYR